MPLFLALLAGAAGWLCGAAVEGDPKTWHTVGPAAIQTGANPNPKASPVHDNPRPDRTKSTVRTTAAPALAADSAPPAAVAPGTVRIAGIVLKWIRGEKEANFRRLEPLLRQAAAGGAKIVCTTECFLDGYAIADKRIPLETYRALGEPIPDGLYCRRLAALARELKIHLVAGLHEADGDQRYNTAVLLGPGGELLGKYRKQQLDHESVRNTPGNSTPVFNTPYGHVGLIICADRRRADIVRQMREAGADFFLCPSGGMFGPKSNDHILQARSKENRAHIVFVHPAEFLVTGPDGSVLSQTVLGDRLLVPPDETGSAADGHRIFYFDMPLAVPSAETCFPPPDEDGGWRQRQDVGELRLAGLNKQKLDEAFDYVRTTTKNGGLLVLHDGWLVYERYFGKGHRDALCNLASCGKSFTSIAVGILMAERPELFPDGLDQKIFTPQFFPPEAFPLSDPRKAEIKLGQLLSFSAGIRGNNPGYVRGREIIIAPAGPDGWTAMVDDIALGKRATQYQGLPISAESLWCEPGEGYSYATASIHLASLMLRHLTGRELRDYVEEKLARPLGWGRWTYAYRSAKQVTHTPGGGGIALRATDMLRFGYLLLNEGRWRDRQIVPAGYVRHCRSQSPHNPHYPYSLQFNVNTRGEIPELPRDAFWKSGSGGHCLYVVPSAKLVVWKLGGRDAQYSPADTGLPVLPHVKAAEQPGPGGEPPADPAVYPKTLLLLLDAITERK